MTFCNETDTFQSKKTICYLCPYVRMSVYPFVRLSVCPSVRLPPVCLYCKLTNIFIIFEGEKINVFDKRLGYDCIHYYHFHIKKSMAQLDLPV